VAPSSRPPTEAELVARLEGDRALRAEIDTATWQGMQGWLRPALRTLAQRSPAPADADAAYRALRDSALLLGDTLVAGTATPDFADSLAGIEAYLMPFFPRAMEQAFPALIEEAQRLHRQRAPTATAAARLTAVLRAAFT
jgi:hypothetical protein